MKKIKYFFTKIIYPATFLFTIFTFLMYLIAYSSKETVTGAVLHPAFLAIALLYFIIVSVANKIFKSSLSMGIKIVIHFSSIVIPLIAILAFSGKGTLSVPTITMLSVIFCIIYLIFAVPTLLIASRKKRNENENEKYENQFDKIR